MIFESLLQYKTEISSAFLAITALYGFWKSLISEDKTYQRLKKINERRESLKLEALSSKNHDQRSQQKLKKQSSMGFIRQIVHKMKLLGNKQVKEIQLQLSQAGYRNREALIIFLFIRFILPFILGSISVFAIYFFMNAETQFIFKLLVFVLAVFIGYYSPSVFIKNTKQKRLHEIQKALPDCLDLLVICAQAGLSLDSALQRVSHEMGESYPEIGDELSLTAVELGFLQDRTDALHNLAKRVDLSQMRSLINTLIQTEKYGTPLSQSLRVLSQEYRDERMMRAEEKAARLPAILTLPMIVFILPPLFIVLLGPGIIQAIDSFSQMK